MIFYYLPIKKYKPVVKTAYICLGSYVSAKKVIGSMGISAKNVLMFDVMNVQMEQIIAVILSFIDLMNFL